MAVVKSIFVFYNYHDSSVSAAQFLQIGAWAIFYDFLFVSLCLLPFLIASCLLKRNAWLKTAAMYLSLAMLLLMLLLNSIDIFYFPFHRQRADADLLYVLRDPASYGGFKVWLVILFGLVVLVYFSWYLWKQFRKLKEYYANSSPWLSSAVMLIVVLLFFAPGKKALLPSRALTHVEAGKLPILQNSLHTFLYSMYRGGSADMLSKKYLDEAATQSLFSIHQQNKIVSPQPRNVILFIMESVPYDFFDSSKPNRHRLPFFDSLRQHSIFYNNAFSYSYSSNKGITAILSAVPTITDIPLYHSGFINLEKTSIGSRLALKNYRSAFFIGDNYDDFGFAKCCNWLGIQQYHSMEDIPGYKKMEKHTMGLHDEYVLGFMQDKLKNMEQPFFVTQYNISTHYPNNLTTGFAKRVSGLKATPAEKSMLYYDWCMQQFFAAARHQPWFNNTIFIFCSDHWATPDNTTAQQDVVNSFRIPILIFDPIQNEKVEVEQNVSQLDILNTVLAAAGDGQPFVSYGNSLFETGAVNRTVFCKANNSIYQAINDSIVLGFDADLSRAVYAYKYRTDSLRTNNLLQAAEGKNLLIEKEMRAFLQTTVDHYKRRP